MAERVSSTRGAGSLGTSTKRGSSTPAGRGSTPNTLDPEPLIIAGAQPRSRSRSRSPRSIGWRAATTGSKSLLASGARTTSRSASPAAAGAGELGAPHRDSRAAASQPYASPCSRQRAAARAAPRARRGAGEREHPLAAPPCERVRRRRGEEGDVGAECDGDREQRGLADRVAARWRRARGARRRHPRFRRRALRRRGCASRARWRIRRASPWRPRTRARRATRGCAPRGRAAARRRRRSTSSERAPSVRADAHVVGEREPEEQRLELVVARRFAREDAQPEVDLGLRGDACRRAARGSARALTLRRRRRRARSPVGGFASVAARSRRRARRSRGRRARSTTRR